MRLLPSGANTENFRPLNRLDCCKEIGLDSNLRYVCFIGTLLAHQGVDVLIESAPLILKKFPECRFVIIGEGPMKTLLISEVKKKSLSKEFIFAGQIAYEELSVYVGAMDVCVAPFLKSAGLRSPVKLFDYMACGKPIVSSRINGTTDQFENSTAITLVEPEEPAALANAVSEILTCRDKAKFMGKQGRKLVVQKYDRKLLVEKIVQEAILSQRI